MDETKRRRKIQKDFNKQHNIIPQTIKKKNRDLLTSMMVRDNQKVESKFKLDDFDYKIEDLDNLEILDLIEKSKRKMKKYAQNFQFEDAALLRDQIIKLNEKIKK